MTCLPIRRKPDIRPTKEGPTESCGSGLGSLEYSRNQMNKILEQCYRASYNNETEFEQQILVSLLNDRLSVS